MKNVFAAIDLGSNSFRLLISRVIQDRNGERIVPIDHLKESVRMAAGLDEHKRVNQATIDNAIDVLTRFGDRIRSFEPEKVRAVATNTFRVATNLKDFLPQAQKALGFPIEVIAGREEARLIFAGVTNTLPSSNENRLVIDIGGGSTEFIIGRGQEPLQMESLYMGCVTYSNQFFADQVLTAKRFKQAQLAAAREVERIEHQYQQTGWVQTFGSSGTAKALEQILLKMGWVNAQTGGITREGMYALREHLIQAGTAEKAQLKGIKPDRFAVLPGGLAIMIAICDQLGIDQLHTADGALRLGVIVDLLDRTGVVEGHEDRRKSTIESFMRRFDVVGDHAQHVMQCAAMLFKQGIQRFDEMDEQISAVKQALQWAAQLHEIGLSIAHDDYHKHSAYLLEYADMPGFSRIEQSLMALICLGHAGKLSKVSTSVQSPVVWIAIAALRIAVCLLRRREPIGKVPIRLHHDEQLFALHLPAKWLEQHPLTDFALRSEIAEWGKVGFTFQVVEETD